MEKPRMTLDEVLTRMRKSGLSIGQIALANMLAAGELPFGRLIGTGPTGRRNFLILRADFEEWAKKYLEGGGE